MVEHLCIYVLELPKIKFRKLVINVSLIFSYCWVENSNFRYEYLCDIDYPGPCKHNQYRPDVRGPYQHDPYHPDVLKPKINMIWISYMDLK